MRALADRYAEDLARCREILRDGSKSFYAASRILPRRVRDPASAVYAFCRVADDAVDDAAPGSAFEAVERLRARLDRVYADRPDEHPIDRALAGVVSRHALPRTGLDALLEGFLWDAEGRRYEDLSGVLAYSARVASAVGVVMTWLMGPRDPRVLARACDLGAAMQLTNICRDVGEDARNGRVYLPLSWMRDAGIDPDGWLKEPKFSEALGAVVERVLREADALYAKGDLGVAMLPRDCRPSIRAAGLIYADIGRVVRARGCDSVSARAVVSGRRKLALVARASLAVFSVSRQPGEGDPPPLDEVRFLIGAGVLTSTVPNERCALPPRVETRGMEGIS